MYEEPRIQVGLMRLLNMHNYLIMSFADTARNYIAFSAEQLQSSVVNVATV